MSEEIFLPRLGSTTAESAKVITWLVEAGAEVTEGQPVVEVSTDKTDVEIEAPAAGRLLRIDAPEGTVVEIGGTLGWIGGLDDVLPSAGAPAAEPESDPAPSPIASPADPAVVAPGVADPAGAEPGEQDGGVRAAPAARRRAAELGVDLRTLVGSGPGGRITVKDVEAATATPAAAAAGDRLAIAGRMAKAWNEVPAVTLQRLVHLGDRPRPSGVGVIDELLAAVVAALVEHPALNAWWVDGQGPVARTAVDLGYAVQTPRQLVVPVISGAEARSVEDLAAARRAATDRALAGRLKPADMGQASFTVTNLGPFGVDGFTPIIDQPAVGILGVGRIHDVVVPVPGRLDVRRAVWLSLTFDHRAVDGAPAAAFLAGVADRMS